MTDAIILCPKCGKLAYYNSHFKQYLCEKCDWMDITMTEKSEEYRCMCNCPEIQNGHEWKEGDRYSILMYEKKIIYGIMGSIICVGRDYTFLPDIRWYLERFTKKVTIQYLSDHCTIALSGDSSIHMKRYSGASPEIALIQLYMWVKYCKMWNEDRKEWAKV